MRQGLWSDHALHQALQPQRGDRLAGDAAPTAPHPSPRVAAFAAVKWWHHAHRAHGRRSGRWDPLHTTPVA